ncbi:GrdX family protein [Faecalicatena sp. AGMB00832]|uniref:GrdX family protein n=1 Tax=Faecalicatena faecalis TaxID=2726362 RepID=A0ABS6D8M8_9FIRM|nr:MULTISPECIES: GrdX family protein [Faecalicatena]MBU3877876.1 GrdX family protein [Faecalicatena faecalis]MCI6465444.1 GrdX family protein [Faecalicatena sp.]MDY5617276.1 GrdX family protein [Lachnospiraceae bacterium]
MSKNSYIVITNNPLVLERLNEGHKVIYKEISYEEILKEARDRIHDGHRLLTHPLSGSVKPNETPYKSILITERKEKMDEWSVKIIESAIQACGKFEFKSDKYKPEVYRDFQLIDWTLLESGLASADAW